MEIAEESGAVSERVGEPALRTRLILLASLGLLAMVVIAALVIVVTRT